MSTHRFDDEIQDNDPTDELPVLTDVILGEDSDGTASMPGPATETDDTGRFRALQADAHESVEAERAAAARLQEDLDARNERLSLLEAELTRLQERWSETEAALATRDTELSRLRAELDDREATIAEQRSALESSADELREHETRISELTADLASERDRAAGLERSSADLQRQIADLESKIEDMQEAYATEQQRTESTGEDATLIRLRGEVAALAQHIENRNAVWHEQAETLSAQSTRIRELEIEVAQRLERQLEAERLAEAEAASAREARERLGQALEALKRSRESVQDAATPQVSEPEAITDDDQKAQLRRELAQTVLIQAREGDNAETLSRLAELEAAIIELEAQMEPGAAAPKEASPPTPARLVCLTAAEPTEYPLDESSMTIGRGSSCEIQIGTHYVSREHARITVTESGCTIEDLGSRNGVFVNAVKVERHELRADDLITVGDMQFRYQAGENG